MCILGVLEGREGEKGSENIFEEIMTEQFPNLIKNKSTDPTYSIISRWDKYKRAAPIHILAKFLKKQ